jgi:hypothetical protein
MSIDAIGLHKPFGSSYSYGILLSLLLNTACIPSRHPSLLDILPPLTREPSRPPPLAPV